MYNIIHIKTQPIVPQPSVDPVIYIHVYIYTCITHIHVHINHLCTHIYAQPLLSSLPLPSCLSPSSCAPTKDEVYQTTTATTYNHCHEACAPLLYRKAPGHWMVNYTLENIHKVSRNMQADSQLRKHVKIKGLRHAIDVYSFYYKL